MNVCVEEGRVEYLRSRGDARYQGDGMRGQKNVWTGIREPPSVGVCREFKRESVNCPRRWAGGRGGKKKIKSVRLESGGGCVVGVWCVW